MGKASTSAPRLFTVIDITTRNFGLLSKTQRRPTQSCNEETFKEGKFKESKFEKGEFSSSKAVR